jgi:hypothetical protein
MAIVRCDLTTLQGRVIAALNAAPAAAWATTIAATDDPRHNTTEIQKAILAADTTVCKARASTLGDGYRSLFLTDSGDLTHGSVLPDHLGDIEQVRIKYVTSDSDYKAGKFDESLEVADIENWRANVGSIYGANHNAADSVLSGYYIVQGDQIFFTGHVARCQVANVVRSGACQAPDVDEDIVLGLAVGNLIKEGSMVGALATIVDNARRELAAIQGRTLPMPILQSTEAAMGT